MANVLLGVTGSVAAIRTPALYEALQQAGHRTRIVATQAALYFFDPAMLDRLVARTTFSAAASQRGSELVQGYNAVPRLGMQQARPQ